MSSTDASTCASGDKQEGNVDSREESRIEQPENIPKDVEEAIQKTVGYVSRHGLSFEERLCANGDTMFDFVKPDHMYNLYYRNCLKKAMKPEEKESSEADTEATGDKVIEAPPPLHFHTPLPPVSATDLEIIKTTALAVAANSEHHNYLEKLVAHQQELGNHAQFEFTVKSHTLYPLLCRYIDQYNILIRYLKEQGDDEEGIRSRIENKPPLLERARKRALHARQERATSKQKQKKREEEMLRYASIDWQKFSIVGLIEFDAIDEVRELPPPLKRSDLLHRSLRAKAEPEHKVEPAEDSTPEQTPSSTKSQPDIDQSLPGAQIRKGMKIKAAGLSRMKAHETQTLTCPLSGKKIPEEEFDSHLRTLLRDPRYQQQQDNYMRKNFANASSLNSAQVFENIQRLVRKRTAPEIDGQNKRKM